MANQAHSHMWGSGHATGHSPSPVTTALSAHYAAAPLLAPTAQYSASSLPNPSGFNTQLASAHNAHSLPFGHTYPFSPHTPGLLPANGMPFYLPALHGYGQPHAGYQLYDHITPPSQLASPPPPPTPAALMICRSHSPLGPSLASTDGSGIDLAGAVNLKNFSFSFQVWLRLEKAPKVKKEQWLNMKGKNVTLPLGSTLAHVNLHEFKKKLAKSCVHKGEPCGPRVRQCDREGLLQWLFHVNGSSAFRRDANISVTTEEEFTSWIEAAAAAGRRTIGVRIMMAHPEAVAEGNKMSSTIGKSLKRANCTYVPSSDAYEGNKSATDEEDDDSDQTLDEDPHQALVSRITTIKEVLSAGHPNNGETPVWTDPCDPRHVITLTPAHFKVWAKDLLDKIPGVTVSAPPLNRPEFKRSKRPGGSLAALVDEPTETSSPAKHSWSALSGRTPVEIEALALEVETPLVEFLHFAQIREASLVQTTSAQRIGLGMDAWFMLKSDDCVDELRAVGMTFGTIRKLTIAARAYESVLATRALNQVASGSGSQA